MKTLRFHRSLYVPAAVSEAIAVFAEHGELRVDDVQSDHIVVELVASDPSQEQVLGGEFANYALGASAHARQRPAE